MIYQTLISVALSLFAWTVSASSTFVIDGEFEIQPYVLLDENGNSQGYRQMTTIINEANEELILFGGISGSPNGLPRNRNIYTLDLKKSSSEQDWEFRRTDVVVPKPWFTSTRGFIGIDGNYYLVCNDEDEEAVYSFNPGEYLFALLSVSDLEKEVAGSELNAGDCSAVGVTILNGRYGNKNKEQRIYIKGGAGIVGATPEYWKDVRRVFVTSVMFYGLRMRCSVV